MEILMNVLSPLATLGRELWAVMPSVAVALVFLLAGLWGCYLIRVVIDRSFKVLCVDDLARKAGLSTVLYRLGLGPSLTHITVTVASAVCFLAVLLGAAQVMNLPVFSEFLRRMVALAPPIFAAVMVLGGGLFIGDMAGRIVYRAADANHVRGAEALMRITHGLVVLFSGFLALEYLGFDLTILRDSMNIIIGAIGLGFAIAFGVAFGMAGRDTAERWIRDLTPRSKSTNGEPRPTRVSR